MDMFNSEGSDSSLIPNNYHQEIAYNQFLSDCIKRYTRYIHAHKVSDFEDDLIQDTCEAFCKAINSNPENCTLSYFIGIGKYKVADKIRELQQERKRDIIKYEAQLPEKHSFAEIYNLLKDNTLSERERIQEQERLLGFLDKIKNDTLNENELKIIQLRYDDNLNFPEIDTLLGFKSGNANSVCYRAIKKLKKAYSQIYPKPFST